MNRTVVPVLIVSLAGSNVACDVPLPIIFTSTTAPAGSAGVAAAAVAAGPGRARSPGDAAHFLSAPEATAVHAASAGRRGNRHARPPPGGRRGRAWERVR